MATADEILATMSEETTQSVIVIDNDLRTINIPENIKILGVESDDDVLRLHFRMPKMYGEVDLSEFAIRINYMNAAEKGDVYVVTDAVVVEDHITFSWLVGRTATERKGDVNFIVCLKQVENGVVEQEFNTTLATLKVLEGLETENAVAAKYPDVLESILKRLDDLEQTGGTGGSSSIIDDTTPSSTTTYSSEKIEAELEQLNEAIEAKGNPTDEQVSAAVNEYLTANPVSGISTTAKNLLITILRSGVYTDDQSANITALETALGSSGEDSGGGDDGGDGGGGETPEVTTYTISNELINCTSSNSTTSVEENAAYSTTLTANDGYTLTGGTVTVTMNGMDITDTAYVDGVITISAVTGNVEIFASAVAEQAEAVLPTDGLMAYFDLRNAPTDETVGTATGIANATIGSGSLFSWATQAITSSDDYGAVLPRALMYSADGGTTQTDLGTEFSVITLVRGAIQGGINGELGVQNSNISPLWKFKGRYNTDSILVSTDDMGSGNNDDASDYNFGVYRVNGTEMISVFDTSRYEFNGEDYDGFVSWYSLPPIGTIYNKGTTVACAMYNRMLTDTEVEEARAFFKTLEVTA